MRKEIKNHAMMSHPNIIRFYHLIEDDDKLYMLLEYAPNGDLYKYIVDKERFSEKDACKIVAQVALALQYVHKKGILHRDLKPENILLDANFVVKVSDFGWCGEYKRNQRHSGETPTHRVTFCGTYEYMAPEVIKGDYQDEKVDVWSLGILLYELLHGKTPFRSNAPLEIQRNIIEGRFNIDKRLSPAAIDLLRRILRANPNDRYSVKQVLAHPYIRVVLILIKAHIPNIQEFLFDDEPEMTTSPERSSNHRGEQDDQGNDTSPLTTRMTTERMKSRRKEPKVDIQAKLTGLISKSKSKMEVENRTTMATSNSVISEAIVGKLSEKSRQAAMSNNDSPIKVRDSEPAKGTQKSGKSPAHEINRNHSMEKTGAEIDTKKKLESLRNQILNQTSRVKTTSDVKMAQSTPFGSGDLKLKAKTANEIPIPESPSGINIIKLAMSPKQSERKIGFFDKGESPSPSIFKSNGVNTSRALIKSEADADKLKVLVQTINQSLIPPATKRPSDRLKENKSIDGKIGFIEAANKASADLTKLFEKGQSAQNRSKHSPDPKEVVAAVISRVKNSARSNVQAISSLLSDKKIETRLYQEPAVVATLTERPMLNPKVTTLKKEGITASNKSLSLLDNLTTQLNRKLSNSALIKSGTVDRRDLQTSRSRNLPSRETEQTHSRNDSQASAQAGGRAHSSQDKVDLYSQPSKRSHIVNLLKQTRPRMTSPDTTPSSIKRITTVASPTYSSRVQSQNQSQNLPVGGGDNSLDADFNAAHNIYKK